MSPPTPTILAPLQRVLGIPELLDLVALLLDKEDLARLLRVSRSLFTYVRPYVWVEVRGVLLVRITLRAAGGKGKRF
jgi:hypothetical protein